MSVALAWEQFVQGALGFLAQYRNVIIFLVLNVLLTAGFFMALVTVLKRRERRRSLFPTSAQIPDSLHMPVSEERRDLEGLRLLVLLPEVAKKLTSAADIEILSGLMIQQTSALFPFCEEVGFFAEQGENLVLKLGKGIQRKPGLKYEIAHGEGLIGYSMLQNMILWQDEFESRFGRQRAGVDRERNYYCPDVSIPIVFQNKRFGCLTLKNFGTGEDRLRDQKILSILADIAGISCSHVLQMNVVNQKNVLLNRQAQELSDFNRNLQGLVDQKVFELRQAEQRLLQTEQIAVFGEFLATIAHDIKTPLAFISGEAQWAGELLHEIQPDIAGLKNSLSVIQKNSQRMQQELQDLLGKIRMPEFKQEKVVIRKILAEILPLVRQHAAKRGIEIVESYGDRVADELPGYAGLLRHAFMNLLSNAIEAMPNGGRVLIQINGDAGGNNACRVRISDNGVGISAEDLPKVFDLFFTKRASGTGLGLSSVKRIIEKQHRGRIEVRSQLGKGTEFDIELPLQEG